MKLIVQKKIGQMLIVFLLGITIASTAYASGTVELKPLEIGLGPGLNAVPFVFSADLPVQFPSAAGFSVQTYSSRADLLQALADGSIDGALLDIVDAIRLLQEGLDIRIAAELPLHYHAYTLPGIDFSSIVALDDLGKDEMLGIAVRSRSSIAYTLNESLGRAGLMKHRVEIIEAEDDFAVLQALFNATADIAIIPLPFAAEADMRGAVRVVEDIVLRPGAELLVFREDVLLESMDEIIGSMRAYNRSIGAQYRAQLYATAEQWWSGQGLQFQAKPELLREVKDFNQLSAPSRETFNYFQFRMFEDDPESLALRFESVMFALPTRARNEIFN